MVDHEFSDDEFSKYIQEKNDLSHWLFCKDTMTKLLPKFFYILAKTFVDTPSQYLLRLDRLCNGIGKLSDDGDKYVDKFSGYTIRNIDFAKEYGTEETIDFDIRVEPVVKKISGQPKKILNIINAMETTMQIFLDENPLIISIVEGLLEFVPSEEEFTENMRLKKEKNPKIKVETYKNRVNTMTLYYTLSAMVFAIQVHIPTVRFRSVPGCSFKGKISDQEKLVDYIACIAKKMSNMVEPWNVLSKTPKEKIVEGIKFNITQFSNLSSQIKNVIADRIEKKKEDIEQPQEDEYRPIKWEHFLPAIVPFKIKTLSPIANIRITQLSADVKSGNKRQTDTILMIKSKIIFYAYMFQQKIQEIVSNQALLFYTKQHIPYLDNACCSSEHTQTTLSYFINIDPEIGKEINFLNEQSEELKKIINHIYHLSKSSLFCSDIDTKNKIILTNNLKYSESTIIRYLMFINKFANITDSEEDYKIKLDKKVGAFQFTEENFFGMIGESLTIDIIIDEPPVSMKKQLEDLLEPDMRIIKDNLDNDRNLNNAVFTENKKYMSAIIEFINESKLPKSVKKNVSVLTDLMEWKGSFVNHISFIKKYIYLFSKVFPNIIINKVEQNNLIHSYWNLSLPHSTKISEFCLHYYQPLNKFQSKINDLLEKVMIETENIYEISMKTPYMAEEYSTILLNVNYLLMILHKYITTIEENPEMEDENFALHFTANRNIQETKEVVASLLAEYFIYIKDAKDLQNKSYQNIIDNNLLLKQTEKQAFRKRLEVLSEEEREVDGELRKAGLGIWSKGTSKSVYQYSVDINDDQLVNLLEQAEKLHEDEVKNVDSDVEDSDVENDYELPEYDEDDQDE